MRQAFINTIIEIAEQDKNLYLLTADMGFGMVEPFATKFPKRYINVGVAEQNMIGIATGLALEGKKVFCYSIGNFPTMRCLEHIRNDVCYHNLPVCIVSGGAGLWYGALGMTHWAVEDIAVMRCLPNMAVVSPCDAWETGRMIKYVYRRGGPCYLRMSRTSGNPSPEDAFTLDKAPYLVNSSEYNGTVIIATGGQMVANALEAQHRLRHKGVQVGVLNANTIKPLDRGAVSQLAISTDRIITVEEHSKIGGLGSAVAEVLATIGQCPPLVRMGTEDRYPVTAISYEELLNFHRLDVDSIVEKVLDASS